MKKFYDELFALKRLIRRGWLLRLPHSNRLESDAEHIFSCCMLALKIINDKKLDLDQEKVIKILLYHELGEIEVGDITIADHVSPEEKYQNEKKAVHAFASKYNMPEIATLWEEFEEKQTPEAKFCKMIDKLDAVMQAREFSNEIKSDEPYNEFKTTSKEVISGYEDLIEAYISDKKKD